MKKVKVKTKNIKQTKNRRKKKSHKYSFMITLKFAYKIIFGDKELLEKLRKQFSSLVHIFYNLFVDVTMLIIKGNQPDINSFLVNEKTLLKHLNTHYQKRNLKS